MPKRKASRSTQRTRSGGTVKTGTRGKKKATTRRKAPARRTKARLDLDSDVVPDMLEFESQSNKRAVIKVIGVGGAGGNVVNTMIESGLGGVEFVAGNTDAQALAHNQAPLKLQLGTQVTGGLGCGANPDWGRASALESRDRLTEVLQGADMVFVTAGMGGGTGTGAAPIVAEVAREVGALTVGVVTKPFIFEGRVRSKHADRGIDDLHSVVDTLITIPNQRLLALAGKNTALGDAFKLADEVLLSAVRGISDLITVHGLINLDFADVRAIMTEAGVALMGTGFASGEDRAAQAAGSAISSPLLEDLSIDGAQGVLINITGGPEMTLHEVNEASTLVQEAAHDDANIIFGAVVDDSMAEKTVRVTVIATGLADSLARRPRRQAASRPRTGPRDPGPPLRAPAASESVVDGPDPAAIYAREEPLPGPAASDALLAEAEGFASPFDEEYDVPAFLRKPSRDGDSDEPTFN